MITRNRRIKQVFIHATQMKNAPVYSSVETMNRCLDAACRDVPQSVGPSGVTSTVMPATSRIMQNLKALQNGPYFNKQTGEDEYSDSEFSKLYKKALWHDNVMRSAFLHNLDRLLTSRGFNVQRRSIFMPEAVSEASSESLPEGLPEALSQASPEVEAEGTETLTMMSNTEADHRSAQAKEEVAERYLRGQLGNSLEEKQWQRRCEEIMAALLGLKTTEIESHCDEIEHMRIRMGRQMDANPDHRQLYLRLFTDPRTVRHYLNLKLAISKDEKLQANAERNFANDFGICTLESSNSRVQLLRQLIAAFNPGMLPTLCLKSYDLTLKQASYDENESIRVPDAVWARLQHTLLKMRRPRPRPVTRRSLMHCIFILAVDLFGKHFTTKKKTCKRRDALKSNVYNYETDRVALGLVVKLMAMSHRTKMCDIEPELVDWYDLLQWQRDHAGARCSSELTV